MAELMIVLLGFGGVISGLEKLSALKLASEEKRVTGLAIAAALQTAGSTMAMICTSSGDYSLPMGMVLAGIVAWALSDRRSLKRTKGGETYGC